MKSTMEKMILTDEMLNAVCGGDAFVEGPLDNYDKYYIALAVRDSKKMGHSEEKYLAFCKSQGFSQEALAYISLAWNQPGFKAPEHP